MASFLRRQLLDQRFTGDPAEVVEVLAGLNAQTARGPSVGLWTRMASFDQRELDRALGEYRLVKANLMRATVHMVTRRQYRTWRLALQPTLEATVRQQCPGLWDAVDRAELLERGTELLRAHDGLSRSEIGAALAAHFPHVEPRHLGFAIRMVLPVVQVADPTVWRPGRTRYILAEQAFDGELVPADEGLPDLVRSFLRAFGPATVADAGYWTGLSRLRAVVAEVGDRSSQLDGGFDVEPDHDGEPRNTFVLPEFDNVYFCRKRADLPLIAAKKQLGRHPSAMHGSLVAGDQVCGGWVWDSGGADVTLTPWRDLAAGELAEFDRFRSWCAEDTRRR